LKAIFLRAKHYFSLRKKANAVNRCWFFSFFLFIKNTTIGYGVVVGSVSGTQGMPLWQRSETKKASNQTD